jgi:hypothetical protein
MTINSSKIISVVLGIIAIYYTITLIPDKTKKKFIALDKQYSFTKEISVSEKFETDFDSAYKVLLDFENANDSSLPIKKNLQVLRNGKPVELYGNNSFVSKSGASYELKLILENTNDNSNPNRFNVRIQENGLPGPTYELLIEREYKWVLWTIDGLIILIALITGYFGFRKKPAGNKT